MFINRGCSYLGELFGLPALLRGEKAGEQPGWAVRKGDECCNGAAVGAGVCEPGSCLQASCSRQDICKWKGFQNRAVGTAEEMQMELLYLH